MTRPPATGNRLAAVIALVVCMVGISGCVVVPDSGPVSPIVESSPGAVTDEVPAIDPEPPVPGESPAEIVSGFLDAMQASPVSTKVAREYLASSLRSAWDPERATITYADHFEPTGSGTVSVELVGAHRLDARGVWRGTSPTSELTFDVVAEDGQYRIAGAPDALVVPETWFQQRFTSASLYFFDPSASVLVAEPVFAPVGETRASTLVRGLLAGPVARRSGIEQTFIPAHLDAGLSVPVSATGVTTIALTGEATPIAQDQAQLLAAQVVRTVRQDPRVRSVEITIDGTPIRLNDGRTRIPVDFGDVYDPAGSGAIGVLFGLRDDRAVTGAPGDLRNVTGPFGRRKRDLRSVGADLPGDWFAGVSSDGRSVSLAPIGAGQEKVRTLQVRGDSFLQPAWDGVERLWLLDRSEQGARLLVATSPWRRRPAELKAPGITGADVRTFLVSRDGTRLVALLRSGGLSEVVVARIRDVGARTVRVGPPTVLARSSVASGAITDVAWESETTLAILTQGNGGLDRISSIGVDGAPTGVRGVATTIDAATRLIGSPVAGQPLYAVTSTGLANLTSAVRGNRIPLKGIASLDYVG